MSVVCTWALKLAFLKSFYLLKSNTVEREMAKFRINNKKNPIGSNLDLTVKTCYIDEKYGYFKYLNIIKSFMSFKNEL